MNKSVRLFEGLFFSVFFLSCVPAQMFVHGDNIEANPSSIYMAVFGDIQYYSNSTNIGLYQHSLDWIQRKADEGWTFNCILHTGDVTMSNQTSQWEYFLQATRPLAQNIPYITMIGDHDYTWEDGIHIGNRYSTQFNKYTQFPLTKRKIVAWFEEGRMENIVVENIIYGERLDLLILEFGPREEVVAWADAYVKAHPNHHFILMNHEYLEKDGGRRTMGLKCAARLCNTSYTTPEQLWNNLIKCNDNIHLVLCGHVGSLYALTIDTNDFGREIPQIQHNIQNPEFRYDNWLMLWAFPSDRDSAQVFIYNTNTGKYYNDQPCLFKFKYRDYEPSTGISTRKSFLNSGNTFSIDGRPAKAQGKGVFIMKGNDSVRKFVR